MESLLVTPIEALQKANDPELPFQRGIRVACPARRFAARQTNHCLACDMFKGILIRGHAGKMDGCDAEKAARLTSIICAAPIDRKLTYFPED